MSNSEINILRLLLSNKEERYTIKKISELLKINYRIAYEKILLLEKEGLIKVTKAGNSKVSELTNKFNQKVFEAEYGRIQELSKDFSIILDYYRRNMKSQFYVLLLFGSYAKNTQKKHSDIDLLFIIPDDADEKEIEQVSAMIPLKIHPQIFKEKEFIAMKRSKEVTVGSEAIKNNVILHGIEYYYEMIQ